MKNLSKKTAVAHNHNTTGQMSAVELRSGEEVSKQQISGNNAMGNGKERSSNIEDLKYLYSRRKLL